VGRPDPGPGTSGLEKQVLTAAKILVQEPRVRATSPRWPSRSPAHAWAERESSIFPTVSDMTFDTGGVGVLVLANAHEQFVAGRGSGGGPAPVQPRRWLALAVLCVSLLIVSLDTTILNIALPDIVRQLHASETQLQWVVDVYACVFAGLLLVAGSVGDRIGRKRLFCGGLVIFGAASAASAFSSDLTWLDLSRSLMGVGAACIMPATLSIISDIFRDDQTRARAIGIWSGTTGLGVAIGPIAGGWLLVHYWWARSSSSTCLSRCSASSVRSGSCPSPRTPSADPSTGSAPSPRPPG